MSSELQGRAILLSQQTSLFVQYPTYYIVLQFPGLSIILNRVDKAHCSSCLEPKKAFREQEEALELTSCFEKELSMYPCYMKQEGARE
jgi:hypothetical protein